MTEFNYSGFPTMKFLLAVTLILAPSTVIADELGDSVQAAVKKVSPSVVRIQTVGAADGLAVSSQVTTGVVLSEDGYILTSAFGFAAQLAAVFVEDSNGQRTSAKVVARDFVRKLILLKAAEGKFQPARFAPKGSAKVGAYAIATGRLYPAELPAVSVGIVSALKRIHGLALQTDAKISPVNYGGALIGIDGIVLGILVPLSPRETGDSIEAGVEWYDSGIGFAIPAAEAIETAKLLRSGENRVAGIMGIGLSTANPLEPDVSIKQVAPESPAAKAGLKAGDKFTAVNGKPIRRYGEFQAIIKGSYAGDTLQVEVERDKKAVTAEVKLAESLPTWDPAFLGLLVLPDDEEIEGANVAILPDGPAAQAGLPKECVLTKWNDTELKKGADLTAQLKLAAADKPIEITYKAGDTDAQSATVKPTARPETLPELSPALKSNVVNSGKALGWNREELKKEGRKKNTWYYAPKPDKAIAMGAVVLLSEQASPAATIKRWSRICEDNNLLLIVPSNSEGTPLTREDLRPILSDFGEIAKAFEPDSDRLTLVAKAAQAELATAIILNPQIPQLRTAVFVESWPQIAGLADSVLGRKSPSVLLLSNGKEGRTQQALRQVAVKRLKAGQVNVTNASASKPAATIADWLLQLKVR